MRGTRPRAAIERLVERGRVLRRAERILVACSGGVDSVALAAVLERLVKPLALELTLGHVNHGVRKSAWQDEAVVLRIGAALGLAVKTVSLAPGASDEARLRESRYDALCEMAQEAGCTVVATGHNAEDQTETLLLALFRGTGLQGLAGMPGRRHLAGAIDLARPLLGIDRETLCRYVQQSGLPYAIDPTNTDAQYRRNAVRQALVRLRPLFPGLDAAVARAADLVAGELQGSSQASLRQQVRGALREQEALRDVDFAHVEAAVRALESGGSGRFYMKGGVELRIVKGALTVLRDE